MLESKDGINNIEPAKVNESDVKDVEPVVVDETELEEKTQVRLEAVMKGEGVPEDIEEPAEEPDKPEDTTPEEKPEEKSDKPVDSTPEPEVKAEEKEKDIGKGEKEIPQLSDAYYRAAIHRGWKEEDIEKFYKSDPDLCVTTLGSTYEALKRTNEEFASLGRTHKERERAAAEATPPVAATEPTKTEYKGVDLTALEKTDMDPDAMAVVKALDQQNKLLHDQIQTRPVQTPVQPSGPSAAELRAQQRELAAMEQQIEGFFKADEVKPYKDFYGDLPKDAVDWSALSPGQRANRWGVIEMSQDLLTGARINNRDMGVDEALKRAHLNVSESQRTKVMREELKTNVAKRSRGLSLKPSSTNKAIDKTSPRTVEELEETTAERMRKIGLG